VSFLRKLHLALRRLLHRDAWSRLEMHEVRRRFATPEAIDTFMQVCFEYVSDLEHHGLEEHWQDPFTTHELKRGDCEDYALYAWYVLRRNGYEAHVLAVFTEHEGHAVCVFEEHGRFHSICNEGLERLGLRPRGERRRDRRRSLAQLVADAIYPHEWTCCSYVTRLSVIDADGHAPATIGFDPHYEWILPPERRGFVPAFTSRRTGRSAAH
jgi:hypothetical protein